MRSWILRRRGNDESGMTIVEVTLTMLILSIVLVMALDFMDRASRLTLRAEAHGRTEDEVQRAMRTVTQQVRAAKPIAGPCSATTDVPPAGQSALPAGYGNCIQVTVPRSDSALDACDATTYIFGIVTRTTDGVRLLVENRRPVTQSGSTCITGAPTGRRVLLEKIDNDGTQPLFIYYAADGLVIPSTNTATVPKASSVKVTLAARFRAEADPVLLSSRAALRNNISR